jgi:hypothetical protein
MGHRAAGRPCECGEPVEWHEWSPALQAYTRGTPECQQYRAMPMEIWEHITIDRIELLGETREEAGQ